MHHIFYRTLLAIFISLQVVASEEDLESLEEHRLPIYQAEHYQEIELHPSAHRKVNIFIGSNPGQPIPQTSEIPFYDNNAPQFIKHFCEDGVYEFLQKGRETGGLRKAENDEFDYGRMDEIKEVLRVPYKFFGNLLITFPYSQESKNRPGRCIGSGLLMGPNQVLTAGHNLYDHKRGGWAQEIIFTPAQQGEQKPFGEARATVLKAFKGWIGNKAENHDMGVLILDRPIGYQVGWAGLAIIDDTYYLTQKPSIAIAGYPSTDVQLLTQEGAPRISHALMREHQGDVLKAEASRLYYKVNTRGGQSGGPIVAYLEELKGYFVLGIHTHGYDEANEGTRLTATKFWAIHECRKQFDISQPSSISPHKLTTITQTQTSSSSPPLPYEGQRQMEDFFSIEQITSEEKARVLAVNGNSKAQLWMGNYKSSIRKKIDQREAVDWFQKAAQNPKNREQEAVKGIYEVIRKNMPKFFLINLEPISEELMLFNQRNQELLDAASTGNAHAQYILGCKYYDRTEKLLLASEGFELIYNSALQFYDAAIVKLTSIAHTILK